MGEKQKITLKLDVYSIPLEVERSDEEDYRKAGVFLNERLSVMRKKNKNTGVSSELLWVYLALECCANLMSDKRDKAIEPIYSAIDEVNKKIENVLSVSNETLKI